MTERERPTRDQGLLDASFLIASIIAEELIPSLQEPCALFSVIIGCIVRSSCDMKS
jgi:hypothetical protein